MDPRVEHEAAGGLSCRPSSIIPRRPNSAGTRGPLRTIADIARAGLEADGSLVRAASLRPRLRSVPHDPGDEGGPHPVHRVDDGPLGRRRGPQLLRCARVGPVASVAIAVADEGGSSRRPYPRTSPRRAAPMR
jgi:hypothetical protein